MVDPSAARKRKSSTKKRESEESLVAELNPLAEQVNPLAELNPSASPPVNMTEEEAAAGDYAFPIRLNKDGTPAKKRGRPRKNKSGSPAFASDLSEFPTKRTRKSGTSFSGIPGGSNPRELDPATQQRIKEQNRLHIQQQQMQAKAESEAMLNALDPSEARNMMLQNAQNSSSFMNQTHFGAPFGFQSHASWNFSQPQQQQRKTGKVAVTTQTNTAHPQQGTVAPHSQPTNGSNMQMLLKGSTHMSEDMALSNLPTVAGGGVLAGSTSAAQSTAFSPSAGKFPPKTSGKVPLKQQKPQKKNNSNKMAKRRGSGLKRRGSNPSASSPGMVPKDNGPIVTIPDEQPDRLVNPLLDFPPPASHNPKHSGSASISGSIVGPVQGSKHPEAPAPNLMAASELHNWMSLIFPRPDTYSVAQYARWLGFDVPAAHENEKDPWIPKNSNTVPFELSADPTIHHIPPEGTFSDCIWKAAVNDDDDDDAMLQGVVDPLYEFFLKRSEAWASATSPSISEKGSIGSASPFRNLLYHHASKLKAKSPAPQRINEMLQFAQECELINAEDWSVSHSTPSSTSTTTIASSSNIAAEMSTGISVLESATGGMPAFNGVNKPSAGPTVYSSETKPKDGHLWGFTAWQKKRPSDERDLSTALHYQFQWYHLPAETTNKSNVAELVMTVPYGPIPAGYCSANGPIAQTGEDHFAAEMENVRGEELTTRQRLIIILYALTLDHARICDVCYCLLKVPKSLVKLLQKFFRMTPISAGKNETSLVPMLCDLQKCSTRYAFLLQKELVETKNRAESIVCETIAKGTVIKNCLLVCLPTLNEAKAATMNPQVIPARKEESAGPVGTTNNCGTTVFHPHSPPARHSFVGIRAKAVNVGSGVANPKHQARVEGGGYRNIPEGTGGKENSNHLSTEDPKPAGNGENNSKISTTDGGLQFKSLNREGKETEKCFTVPDTAACPGHWEVLRSFAMVTKPAVVEKAPVDRECQEKQNRKTRNNDVLRELRRKQQELKNLEAGLLEPTVNALLEKVIEERWQYETSESTKRRGEEREVLEANQQMLARRKELDEAWQKQLEQDMDAVCEICNDGEVTPDNQILFCEACDVAVHQLCYGIEEVPEGDYYCMACRYFDRQKVNSAIQRQMRYQAAAAAQAAGDTDISAIFQTKPTQTLPICCELCPVRNGAYVRTETKDRDKFSRRNNNSGVKSSDNDRTTSLSDRPSTPPSMSKWVHMVCAKWQGLNFIESLKPDLVVEELSDVKLQYRLHDIKCCLCLGERGAFNQCRFDQCSNWLHVTCARASGLCDVIHGENALGPVEENPWTLLCPDHSNLPAPGSLNAIEGIRPNPHKHIIPVHKLVMMAQSFPPEPKLDPRIIYANTKPQKPFNRLTGKERDEALANAHYEQEVLAELQKKLHGVRCEVCDQWEEDGKNLTRCQTCSVVFCDSCVVEGDDVNVERRAKYKCMKCRYVSEMKKKAREGSVVQWKQPQCDVCCQKGGWLRMGSAEPVSKKTQWKQQPKKFAKSLFGRQLWCHCLCSLWCAPTKIDINAESGHVELSQVILSNGSGFIKPGEPCFLCGNKKGLKEPCGEEDCCCDEEGKTPYFHPICARQAGFEVRDDSESATLFYLKCYKHGGNEFNLRARLEDLIEIENKRAGKNGHPNRDVPMTFADASRLLNASILCMRILGWAWRWAEWWVEYGSNWEPLLEPGQNEKKMTKEELKIVDSTPESRREDARRCRLAPLGAALRNRSYDVHPDEESVGLEFNGGFDHNSLGRALRAILHTPSLVGPLKEFEIEFFAEWLGRAYRSKSRLLGFGDDKIEVGNHGEFCLHSIDKSPKHELGRRPLPGKQELPEGQVFEDPVEEVDDFEVFHELAKKHQPTKVSSKAKFKTKGIARNNQQHTLNSETLVRHEDLPSVPRKRGPGRPPKRFSVSNSPPQNGATHKKGLPPNKSPSSTKKSPAKARKEGASLVPSEITIGTEEPVLSDRFIKGQRRRLERIESDNAEPPKKRARGRPKRDIETIIEEGTLVEEQDDGLAKNRKSTNCHLTSLKASANHGALTLEGRPSSRLRGRDAASPGNDLSTLSAELVPHMPSEGGGLNNQGPQTPKASERKQVDSGSPMVHLPSAAQEFLESVGLFNGQDFLATRTAALGEELAKWRAGRGMSKLRGTGAAATISMWKARVREREPKGATPEPSEEKITKTSEEEKKKETSIIDSTTAEFPSEEPRVSGLDEEESVRARNAKPREFLDPIPLVDGLRQRKVVSSDINITNDNKDRLAESANNAEESAAGEVQADLEATAKVDEDSRDCLEARLQSSEEYSKNATSVRQRARLIGKYESAEEFFSDNSKMNFLFKYPAGED